MKKIPVLISFVTVLILIALVGGCTFNGNDGATVVSVSSKGFDGAPSIKKSLNGFSAIVNNTPLTVEYCRSDENGVVILGDTSIMDSLKVEIRNGKLVLGLKPGVYRDIWLKVLVNAPHISTIHQNGSGKIVSDSIVDQGARFDVVASGSGDIIIKGVNCKDVKMVVNGSGDIKAGKVMAKTAKLYINGSGSVMLPDLLVEENLDADINGSGDIAIDGAALKVKARVNGSGSISGKLKHQDLESWRTGSGNIDLKKE